MKAARARATLLLLCGGVLAGCATGDGRYLEPRSGLDRSIFYVEKDKDNAAHPLSGADAAGRTVTRVPLRTVVDLNSTIQILVDKQGLGQGAAAAAPVVEPRGLLQSRENISAALNLIEGVVNARLEVVAAFERRDLPAFQRAARARALLETELIDRLAAIWPETSKTYARLVEAYDPPTFEKLQAFLGREIDAANAEATAYEAQLRTRQRTLSLEAFLSSPGREDTAAAAIHLEGYDSIKNQSLNTRDRLGLDLSPEELARLKLQVQATQNVAAALERLRRGEASLNQAVRQIRSEMAPRIASLLEEAEQLAAALSPGSLAGRRAETRKLLDAYLAAVRAGSERLFAERRAALEKETQALLDQLGADAGDFSAALAQWIQGARALRAEWETLKPELLVDLVQRTSRLVSSFESLRQKLPKRADEALARIDGYFRSTLGEIERGVEGLAGSGEAARLRNDLRSYSRDFQRATALVQQVLALRAAEVSPIAEMPPATSMSFDVPLEDIKDTFVDLETTPRLVGDVVSVKATLKDGARKPIDTSVATFRMGRYGYYADLSPAIILVKPDELRGGDDGFRFAPSLSWMHHWVPRPAEAGTWASIRRSIDPAIGIHSVFTNFSTPTSSETVQIGLGATVSFWKNRLQFGYGYNLMADSNDEGRRYFFIGSDLIGLLQAAGIAKQ